jgi:hypothetical protein
MERAVDVVWTWLGQSLLNQLLAGGALVVLLAAVLILLLRRRARGDRTPPAERRELAEADPRVKDLTATLEGYRHSHPVFYRVMQTLRESQGLDRLVMEAEVADATACLRRHRATVAPEPRGKASGRALLHLSAPGDRQAQREIRSAMLTILRVVYASDNYRAALAASSDSEVDRLLDSLTD